MLTIDPTRKHDLESLFYTLIYLFTGDCPYGHLEQNYQQISSSLSIKHQEMKRELCKNEAKNRNMSIAEYLCRDIEIGPEFVEFGNTVFNYDAYKDSVHPNLDSMKN